MGASIVLAAMLAACAGDDPPPGAEWATHVAPILESRCLKCHGPRKQKAGLRLDHPDALRSGGDSGPAIVPGDPDASRMVARVESADENERMPPSGEPLAPEEIDVLRRWIEAGAMSEAETTATGRVASDHWAFQPIAPPSPPEVEDEQWPLGEIDAFVLARLEARGIAPSPEAQRATLARRLYLDLLGLPPQPEEVLAFEQDQRPDAYGRLVDRLLASPHFGERWGRHWLDLARYADSDGYEKDTLRPNAWRWREWVLDAVSTDMSYDRFVVEQLAGDLLPGAMPSQVLATGFHRNTLTNKEGGVDQEEYRVEAVVDRVSTTGQALLGLTLGCARCHTHKYDPITQREFFQLYAFFDSDDEVGADVPPTTSETAGYEAARREHQLRLAELEAATATDLGGVWTPLAPSGAVADNGTVLTPQGDGSVLATGPTPDRERYVLTFETDLASMTGLRLEVLPSHGEEPRRVGRTGHGNFVLSELTLEAGRTGATDSLAAVALDAAFADHEQDGYPAAAIIDGDSKTGWAVMPEYTSAHHVVLLASEPFGHEGGTRLRVSMPQEYGSQHTIAHISLSATTADGAALRADAELAHLRAHPPAPPAARAAVLRRRGTPRETRVHRRGVFLDPGERVQPGTPSVLPPLAPRGEAPDRLDLARWIVSPENPLTARVLVDRTWRRLFGSGLVRTPDDFGTRGAPPSHPALLDWLAKATVEDGWSRKRLIRRIVLSATYRQASHARPELADPENLLLARQNRFHVEGEIVRDMHLSVAGLLSGKIGGPSVRPPLPADVARLGYANSVKWPVSEGEDRYRRGLYVLTQRTVPYPMLATFDCPDPNLTEVRRERSNSPLQALTTLNDPVFGETASALGSRLLAAEAGGDDDARLAWGFRLCLARAPSDAERGLLAARLESAREHGSERAAWSSVARVLTNVDEFLTRE